MPVLASSNASFSHSTTGNNLLKRAMRIIRVIDPEEDLTSTDVKTGLEALNQMLDSWNAENLTVAALGRQEFAFTGAQTYSIGPSGDFDCPQIIKIEQGDAWLKNGSNEYPIEVVTQERWAEITVKSNTGWPQYLYYEMLAPLGNINLWPIPDSSLSLVLYKKQLLAQVQNPSEQIQLLPGYADAIVWNLAVELAPEYGKVVDEATGFKATETKATIKRQNIKPLEAKLDAAVLDGCSIGNIFSGEVR